MLRRNIAVLTKCTVGLCVLVAALIAGCGMLEETPEQAARRVEAQRQAALPLAEASCDELQRRGNRASANILEGTNAAYYQAAVNELTIRCWIPELAFASCDEVQQRADRASNRLLEGTNAAFYRVAVVVLQERCW